MGAATKGVTRAEARVDRIACSWLIKRFIDRDAEFPYGQGRLPRGA
ncbi:MAG TPA: chromate resistance protein ChrB domain-containing protein [Methylomirabilota bacterium]|nr:chromate resistance protein ChrB domain-containing protein [Methylomirabilota bacterium]